MAITYETAVEEDLNVGYGGVTITNPAGGTLSGNQIGIHTFTNQEVHNVRHHGATGDGATDDRANINTALTTVGATGELFFPPGTYVIASDLTMSSHLVFSSGAILSPSSGATVTINGEITAPTGSQIFTGDGTVAFGTARHEVWPAWWGAAHDGSTDDSTEIQAAIDSIGDNTNNFRSGTIVHIPGPTAISTGLLVDGKSVVIQGYGWGDADNSDVNPSYLVWTGGATAYMVRIQDSEGAGVRNLRFLSTGTNPTAALSLYETDDGNPNSFNFAENIFIGNLPSDAAADTFVNGIQFHGDLNVNNDRFYGRNIRIRYCSGAGVYVGRTQNTHIHFDGLYVSNCTDGVQSAGHISGNNWFFDANTTADLQTVATDDGAASAFPKFWLQHFSAENSARMIECLGGAMIRIMGGSTLNTNLLNADDHVIHAANDNNQYIHISDFRFLDAGGGSAPTGNPHIHLNGAGGSSNKQLILDGCDIATLTGGAASNGIDVTTGNASDVRVVSVRSMPGGSNVPILCENKFQGNSLDWVSDAHDIPRATQVESISGTRTTGRNLRGSATFVTAATVAVSFGTNEPDTSYFVAISGGANETFWVTAKAVGGFTLNSSNGSSTATVDWVLIR